MCPDNSTSEPLDPEYGPFCSVVFMPPLTTVLLYLLAGTSMGLLATRTGIPAAPLAGALIGAAMVSMSGRLEVAQWPAGTKTCLEIAIGTVIGTGLTKASLDQLQQLWKPAVLITLTLVLTARRSFHFVQSHVDLLEL